MSAPRSPRCSALHRLLADLGEPSYRLKQVLHFVYRQGVTEFARMSALPRGVRSALVGAFGPSWNRLRPLAVQHGTDVEKVLFAGPREARGQETRVETVLLRYDGHRRGRGRPRAWSSLCLSTQVGCGLGCTFCATGALGLVRNLTADEICDQVLHFRLRTRVDSVAFMGMGEALANPHTFPALEMLSAPEFFGIAPRRVTVSTVGFLPGLERLVAEHPHVAVTLSVHSPYDEERAGLIPFQQRFPLSACLETLDEHVGRTRRKAYLAYLLLAGVNDSDRHARDLAELVRRRPRPELFHVSVIPYNEAAGVGPGYRRPDGARIARFVRLLRQAGVTATRRRQLGDDLDAACGQLHARYL